MIVVRRERFLAVGTSKAGKHVPDIVPHTVTQNGLRKLPAMNENRKIDFSSADKGRMMACKAAIAHIRAIADVGNHLRLPSAINNLAAVLLPLFEDHHRLILGHVDGIDVTAGLDAET